LFVNFLKQLLLPRSPANCHGAYNEQTYRQGLFIKPSSIVLMLHLLQIESADNCVTALETRAELRSPAPSAERLLAESQNQEKDTLACLITEAK